VKKLRGLFVCGFALLMVFVLAIVPSARASYGSNSEWQIGISGNCFNKSLCTPINGFWGWVVLNKDGTGDAVVDDYMQGSTGLITSLHQVDITSWGVSAAGTFLVSGTAVSVGPGAEFFPPVLTDFDTGIPAAAGHYNTVTLLGFSAPGIAFQFQVTLLPH